jgi:FkbM family methyltransferase
MASVASHAFWRTRNSLAPVSGRSGDAAPDLGAAEGVYEFFLQRLAQRCIAFEPNPSSHWGLKRALPEIEIHQAAVSSVDGDATLRVPVVKGIPYAGWGTIEPKNQLAELPTHVVDAFKVRTVRLDRMACAM